MPLVDSDVLIDALRGISQALGRLDSVEQAGDGALSAVSYLEVLVGCKSKREEVATEKFLRRFALVPLDPVVCERGIDLVRQYHLSHGLLLADGLIAATALVHGMPLLTKNTRDFRFIAGLTLETY